MASVQGIIRQSGVPVSKCYYTAYYKSNNGGSSGPGDGQRASQWMRAVIISEGTGLYSVALSSDVFLGAGATVSNGDQVVIIAWRKSTETPTEAPGSIFSGQRWQDGKAGTHQLGFKYDNGASAAARYGEIDVMVTKTFTMTGQSWNATPGGLGGGDANGDLTLGLNEAPTANISNLSTSQASPTEVARGATVSMTNASSDNTTNKLYTFNSQILLEQCSAAHNPSGGTQTPDGSPTDGSKFQFFNGLLYGQPYGTLVGGDAQGTDWVSFAGPSFPGFSHVFTHVDLYRIALTVKDDNSDTALTSTSNHYVRVKYTAPSISIQARQYASWQQFANQPNDANPNWSTVNPNTIQDVVRVRALVTNPDATTGLLGVETRLLAPVTMAGTSVTISQASIGALLPSSAPFGFLIFRTWSGTDVVESFQITAKTADSVTVATGGSTKTFTDMDWFVLASEPAAGTALTYNWEVSVSGGAWATVGRPAQTLVFSLVTGTTVTLPGIGEGVCPGWWFRVIDGPGRGYYQILAVPSDNQLTLATALPVIPAGSRIEVTSRDHNLFWPQLENDALDFRLTGKYSDGWTHTLTAGPVTNSGSVGNLPPQGVVSSIPDPGVSTTYLFDGRKSYGTQTTWEQSSAFVDPHLLDGSSSFTVTDFALNTATLRDGHAWLALFDSADRITAVFPILDLDRETPNPSVITIDTLGLTLDLQPGQKFRTTNAYEIEPPTNTDNDIVSYAWRLRSAASAQVQPTSAAEFEARFDRVDGSGSGPDWSFTFTEADDGRYACIELTVVDAEGLSASVWSMFPVVVSGGGPGGAVAPRRIEWEG